MTASAPSRPDTERARDRAIVVALLALLTASAEVRANERLTALMQQLAQRQHGHAAFIEHQFLALLDRPLESSGELFYDAPDRLEKRTFLPKAESLVLEKGTLTVRRGAHTYAVSLRAYPQIVPFIDSIRATLAGDLVALERAYTLTFDATDSDWTILLAPHDATLAALVSRIRISGSHDMIQTVEIVRADGDRSVMTIRAIPES